MSKRILITGLALGAAAATALHAAQEPGPRAYVIAQIDVADPDAYVRDYASKVTPILTRHEGRYLARGGKTVPLEGAKPRSRVAILEFPSLAAAERFQNSREYVALAQVRRQYSTADAFIVEGMPHEP